MGFFPVISFLMSLFKLWKLCSVGCATSSSLEKIAPEEEEYVLQQQKRPVWLGKSSKVSRGIKKQRQGRESRTCGPWGWASGYCSQPHS
ncbi:mCG147896 [Mus musculus]|nr:mCG147896 [Mus musculus]